METETRTQLERLLSTAPFAALGSLREGVPFISLVLFAESPDRTSFFIHISGLATHTKNILGDPRASLMIFESGEDGQDPQTLGRISIQGKALEINPDEERFENAKSVYLDRNPQAKRNFELGDFRLFEVKPEHARFVGGFGRIVDLGPEDLRQLARKTH